MLPGTRQPTGSPRTHQRTCTQPLLDSVRVCLYRDHRAYDTGQATRAWAAGLNVVKLKKDIGSEPSAPHRPPASSKNQREVVAYHDPGTVTAPTNKVNTTRPTQTRSAHSAAPNQHYIGILSGG
jgi:hypothetical protein